MDAPSLSPERSRELAALRRRAYGPDADIQRDPDAQRRLRELEDLAHPSADDEAPAQHAPETALVAAASVAPVDVEGQNAARVPTDQAPAATEVVTRPRWSRIPLWAVAAAVGVVGIVAGIAIGVTIAARSAPAPDLTLGISPGAGERGDGFIANLNYWGVNPNTVVPHEPFDAIDVWTARGADDSRCLLLSHEGGFLSATCAGAGLDPVLDFTIYSGLTFDLDAPLPVGTVIRFVARSGAVDVWVSAPGGR